MKITRRGMLKVTKAGVEISQHTTEREALEAAVNAGVGSYVITQPNLDVLVEESKPVVVPPPATGVVLRALSADPIPATAKPAHGASVTDFYGTKVTRVTDKTHAAGSTHVRHEYSRRQAFNCTNTRFLAQASNGSWLLYDAATYLPLRVLSMGGDCEPFWHPTNPAVLWHTTRDGGLVWWERNVETDAATVLVDFTGRLPWAGASRTWTKGEGVPSADGRYFALMVQTDAFVLLGFIVWDRTTNTFTAKAESQMPDHLSMTPSGNRVVVSGGSGTFSYLRDFTAPVQLHTTTEHSDLCVGPNGEDFYVYTDYTSGKIVAKNCDTGAAFDVLTLYPRSGAGYACHISGKAYAKRGWAVISTYADFGNYGAISPDSTIEAPYRKVILAELKAGGRVLNVCHSQVLRHVDYFDEPHATPSSDLSRIIFASDWRNGGEINSYIVSGFQVPA